MTYTNDEVHRLAPCILRVYAPRRQPTRPDDAWPLIRQHIRRRLSHGYQLIEWQ